MKIIKDTQTVTPDGKSTSPMIYGVTFKEITTHIDERGSVCEMFDSRWNWHKGPLVFSYVFTVRPGVVKGWGMHKKHEDRYFILFGEMEVLLYDDRDDSPTKGVLSKIYLSEHNRRLMNIPIGVWHADHNIGLKDAVIVNFPTICYDHASPDKYRLPLNNDKIPYKFENVKGW
jgi:dTDP-4-dehydrorhamnose 3,5-epimerase